MTDLPPIRVERCDAARREPGLMLFNVRGDSVETEQRLSRLSHRHGPGRRHPLRAQVGPAGAGRAAKADGHLLVTIVDGLLLEMTLDGRILRQWYATGRYRDRAPPADAIPVEAETFHHGVNLGPDETFCC